MADPLAPLVITLRMGDDAAARFTALRRAHFPSERNWLDAHVTLFHALPGAALDAVLADVRSVASARPPFTMRVDRVLFLGAGVAYALASAEAAQVREGLALRWADLLGRQDRARRSALHVTVQNKVAPAAARALYEQLAEQFQARGREPPDGTLREQQPDAGVVPRAVPAVGIDVWHYEGGPWRPAASYRFGSTTAGAAGVEHPA